MKVLFLVLVVTLIFILIQVVSFVETKKRMDQKGLKLWEETLQVNKEILEVLKKDKL